ncbi:MAG: hypothetical protein H2174_01065 [Vampirovibrio sp.]|nr:hypothetical protein [Vampirovibrio sp.]
MVMLQPSATQPSYSQKALVPQGALPVVKQSPTNTSQKVVQKQPKHTQFNALPPWQWAIGAGAITGLLTGSLGAFIVGKRYETPLEDGALGYYNQRPANQICLEFNKKPKGEKTETQPVEYRSQTYTYRTLADKTDELIGFDVFDGEVKKGKHLFTLEKSPSGKEGYRLGEPVKNKLKAEVDLSNPFAIYNEAGALQHFFLADNQDPYFKVEWQGEHFTGSVLSDTDDKAYVEAITGTIHKETGLLEAIPTITLPSTTVESSQQDFASSAKDVLEGFHQEKIPLKLPVSEKPHLPVGARLVKFPTHRLASFAFAAIPTALVVTVVVGLIQWCLPPTKKKQQATKNPNFALLNKSRKIQ